MYAYRTKRTVGDVFDFLKDTFGDIADSVHVELPEIVVRGPGGVPIDRIPEISIGFESPSPPPSIQLPTIQQAASWAMPLAIGALAVFAFSAMRKGR